jgi:hypothetical protein
MAMIVSSPFFLLPGLQAKMSQWEPENIFNYLNLFNFIYSRTTGNPACEATCGGLREAETECQ